MNANCKKQTRKLRVAFYVYPTAFQSPGGGEVQLLKTKEYLERLGVEVNLFNQWRDQLDEFDIFHTFGSVKDCLEMIRTADICGVKTVLSTICWYNWKSSWGIYSSLDKRVLSSARQVAKSWFPFIPSMRKSMMEYADLLFPNSQSEADQLRRYFLVPREKIFVIPNGVDPAFADAKPDAFIDKYGFKDFILCVGRIEPRKNQLHMIRALNGTNIPFLIIGDYVHQYKDYYEQCRKEAGKNIHFLGALPHNSNLLVSAFAACNTFLLASWLETPGLAALEAGLAGAKVVITNQGATEEYFQKFAQYVTPDNIKEIRDKTLDTYHQSQDGKLKEHIQKNFLWENTAQKTLEGYQLLTEFHSGLRSLKKRSGGHGFRIGIDLQSIQGQKTGLGVYTENLVRAFFDEPIEGFNFRFYSRQKKGDLNTFERCIWENTKIPYLVRRDKINILHIPAFAPPLIKSCKLVVTVHDLIGMLFPNQERWPSAFYWGRWLPYTLKRADAIIVNSEYTKKDVVKYLGIQEKLIHVIYLSGHERFSAEISKEKIQAVKKEYGVYEKYFLFVGTIEPRKNLERVIEAFAAFLKQNKVQNHFQLVVVGSKGFGHGRFFRLLSERFRFSSNDIIFTGYVSHEDLNTLYCGAEAFVYPSLYEGFGIPVLEAMASGVPVLTSTRTSIPEVAGNAALLVDPYDVNAITQGMIQLAGAPPGYRKELIEKGFERIKHFSWAEMARATLKVYESLL